jgi:membrane protease YdiL (CAAX protease family)
LTNAQIRWGPLLGTLVLAGAFWFFTFYVTWGSFWPKVSFCAAVLAGLSIYLQPDIIPQLRLDKKALLVGLVSAVALYVIFVAGKALIVMVLPFGGDQIGEIYKKGQGTSLWAMAGLSLFVMGPSEELFWRGYLQRELMNHFGQWQGWLMCTILYGGVHFWSFNLTLVVAATVIVSHSMWSMAVFALFPFG